MSLSNWYDRLNVAQVHEDRLTGLVQRRPFPTIKFARQRIRWVTMMLRKPQVYEVINAAAVDPATEFVIQALASLCDAKPLTTCVRVQDGPILWEPYGHVIPRGAIGHVSRYERA